MSDFEELVEVMAAGMYGKNWNSESPDKRPGEKMKDYWRNHVREALQAAVDDGYTFTKEGRDEDIGG